MTTGTAQTASQTQRRVRVAKTGLVLGMLGMMMGMGIARLGRGVL